MTVIRKKDIEDTLFIIAPCVVLGNLLYQGHISHEIWLSVIGWLVLLGTGSIYVRHNRRKVCHASYVLLYMRLTTKITAILVITTGFVCKIVSCILYF